MMRLFLFLIIPIMVYFSVASAENKQSSSSRTISFYFDSINAELNPSLPPSQIPVELIPDGSRMIYIVKLKNDRGFYLDLDEIAMELENPLKRQDLLSYYEKTLPTLDWKILQKEEKNNTSMILAEGNGKTSLTVVVSTRNNTSKIKLFYKKPSLFD